MGGAFGSPDLLKCHPKDSYGGSILSTQVLSFLPEARDPPGECHRGWDEGKVKASGKHCMNSPGESNHIMGRTGGLGSKGPRPAAGPLLPKGLSFSPDGP